MVSQSESRVRGGQESAQSSQPAVGRIRMRLDEALAEGQHRVESRVDTMVHSIHDAVALFEVENEELLARGTDFAARQLEGVARYLRANSLRGLRDDAADLARSHTMFFLGLSLAGGLALGRFARSSARHHAPTDAPADDLADEQAAGSGMKESSIYAERTAKPLDVPAPGQTGASAPPYGASTPGEMP